MKFKLIAIVAAATALLIGAGLSGCGNNAATAATAATPTKTATKRTASAPTTAALLDSIKVCNENVDSLQRCVKAVTEKASNADSSVTSLKQDVKKLEKKSWLEWILWISMGLALLNLFLLFMYIAELSRELKDVHNYVNENIGAIGAKQRQLDASATENGKNVKGQSQRIYDLEQKVNRLTSRLIDLERGASAASSGFAPPPQRPEEPAVVNRYFGAPISGGAVGKDYFKKFEAREYSYFSATVSGSVAELQPIATLDNFKSLDSLELAVEFQGASIKEAERMELLKPGLARLQDNRWLIEQKAVVTLSK